MFTCRRLHYYNGLANQDEAIRLTTGTLRDVQTTANVISQKHYSYSHLESPTDHPNTTQIHIQKELVTTPNGPIGCGERLFRRNFKGQF